MEKMSLENTFINEKNELQEKYEKNLTTISKDH